MRMHAKRKRIILGILLPIIIVLVVYNLARVLAAPTNPGGIGQENLVAWFDAGTGVYADTACSAASTTDGPVACWTDKSDNGLEARQSMTGSRPALLTAQLNGLPIMRFDGNDDVLGTGSDSIDALDPAFPTVDATVFVVQKSSFVKEVPVDPPLFGPFDYIPTADDWPFTLTRLARSLDHLQAAKEQGIKAFVALTGGHNNYTDANGDYSLSMWQAALDRNNLTAFQPYVDDGTIVGLYAVDEPYDWGSGTGPTLAEIDAMCAYASQRLPGIRCGVNAPPWWLAGYNYQHLGFVFTQSNFLRLTSPAAWANWADQQAQESSTILDGPLYLSINAYSGSPTAEQIKNAALALVDSGHATGVMMWKYDLPDFNSLPGMPEAMDTVAAAIDASQLPDPTMQSTFAVSPANATNRFAARIPWSDDSVHWDMGEIDQTGAGSLTYSPFSDTSSFYLWGFEMDSASGQTIYRDGEEKANDSTADMFEPTDTSFFIGGTDYDNGNFSGDIAELIIYNIALSDTNRTHVELYLRDKYDLDLSDAGIYSAPTAYNHSVRGISTSADVFDSDRNSTSAGLRVVNDSFLQDADDIIVFGHNNASFALVEEGLAESAANRRWARLWSFNVSDVPPTRFGRVFLTFDISDAGGTGTFAADGRYYLLKRATGSSDDFSDVIPESAPVIVGDEIQFHVSTRDLGSEFTLGVTETPMAIGIESAIAGDMIGSRILALAFVFMLLVSLYMLLRRKKEVD